MINTISPLDNRYYPKIKELADYFSLFSYIKYRVKIEIEYFIALTFINIPQLKDFDKNKFKYLRIIYEEFCEKDVRRIVEIESTINHDIKAIEYFLKEKFDELNLSRYKEFIHFAITSQDINNTAIPLMLQDAMNYVYYPLLNNLVNELKTLANNWKEITILARTHGQKASPTKLGKEIAVFVERITEQAKQLKTVPHSAKFGGAVGNFNAHYITYPDINWLDFADNFVNNQLGLKRSQTTTQIEHYDNFAAICDAMKRINTILVDFCRDMWLYISFDYLKQKPVNKEVGSSTMPHKINPIDFENAEGNLLFANSVFSFFAEKLPISRLQRDLSDSTVLRNIGVPIAHTIIAFKSIIKGISKIDINQSKIDEELENSWEVVAEAVVNILKRENVPNSYELMKDLTRKEQKINKINLQNFINNLEINENIKQELLQINPFNYTGIINKKNKN